MFHLVSPAARLTAVACLPTLLVVAAARPTAPREPDFERDVLPVLERTCSRCHEGEDAEGGVDFSLYLEEAAALAEPGLWERVGWQVWKHAMPPPSRREQPSEMERAALLRWVDTRVAPLLPAGPPPPAMRRLSNHEYRNAVRDLTGVEFPTDAIFEADPVASGFDNQGGALSLSANRLEKYLAAAERIAAQAVHLADAEVPPVRQLSAASLRGGSSNDAFAALNTNGTVEGDFRVPRAGRYRYTVRAWGRQAGPDACRMALVADRRELQRVEVAALREEPGRYAVEVELAEGAHVFGASFLNDYYKPDAADPADRDRNLYVVGMELEGPLDVQPPTAFQSALLARHDGALDAMVADLADRAWRRPASPSDVAALLDLSAPEQPVEQRLRHALEGILVSPRFLFRLDALESDAHARAARLSFFLHGGLPDPSLQAAANAGPLDEDALRSHAARMLREPRGARALAEGFAAQWLQLRNLEDAEPDPQRFPEFDEALRDSMREETLRLFRHVLDAELPLTELLTADYSFVDARLAAHYGYAVPATAEDGWARVELAATPRRGVLGHASVLTLTSTPVRTSPVRRGKWLLEAVLDAPTPPPPPGVGTLDDGRIDTTLAPRAQLAMHRERRECAVCHDTLDPLGLALENFDATGRWREQDGVFPVDASAVLPDGRTLAGPLELADALVDDEQAIARGLACRLASYALGRPVGPADRGWLQRALDGLEAEPPRLAELVETIAWNIACLGTAPATPR